MTGKEEVLVASVVREGCPVCPKGSQVVRKREPDSPGEEHSGQREPQGKDNERRRKCQGTERSPVWPVWPVCHEQGRRRG